MARLGKYQIPQRREIDKNCKGPPNGFAFAPPPVCRSGVLVEFTAFTIRGNFGPVGFNILTISRPCRFYRFTNVTIFSPLVGFTTFLPFASILGPSCYNILPFFAPYLFYHFANFTIAARLAVFRRYNSYRFGASCFKVLPNSTYRFHYFTNRTNFRPYRF